MVQIDIIYDKARKLKSKFPNLNISIDSNGDFYFYTNNLPAKRSKSINKTTINEFIDKAFLMKEKDILVELFGN